jgi:tripeptidyl-peptidase I
MQEYHLWRHALDGDVLLRTTHYSLPEYLHAHVELVQPTTYFGRPKAMRTTFHSLSKLTITLPPLSITLLSNITISINATSGNSTSTGSPTLTDPLLGVNCSSVVTVSCIQQLYNAVGYKPVATNKNSIGITGYLDEFANNVDLQSFYAHERPDASNSTFQTVLVNSAYIQDMPLSMHPISPSDYCPAVRGRWAEPPGLRRRWPRGRLGHPICLRSHVPHARNVLLDWG